MRRYNVLATLFVFALCALSVRADEVSVYPNPATMFMIAPVTPAPTAQADASEDFAPNRGTGKFSPAGFHVEPADMDIYSISFAPLDFRGSHRAAADMDAALELGFGDLDVQDFDAALTADTQDSNPETAFSTGDSNTVNEAPLAGGNMQFAFNSDEMTAGHAFSAQQLPLGNGMFLSFPQVWPFGTTGVTNTTGDTSATNRLDGTNDSGRSADSKRIGTHFLRRGLLKKDSDGGDGNGGGNGDSTTNVPEPATMLLTGAGFFGLALKRRRH